LTFLFRTKHRHLFLQENVTFFFTTSGIVFVYNSTPMLVDATQKWFTKYSMTLEIFQKLCIEALLLTSAATLTSDPNRGSRNTRFVDFLFFTLFVFAWYSRL